MDNDPSQVLKLAMSVLREIECELSKIPSPLPDLNPCDSIFHIVKDSLDNEAIEKHINKESFDDFKNRVLRTLRKMDTKSCTILYNFSLFGATINEIILST